MSGIRARWIAEELERVSRGADSAAAAFDRALAAGDQDAMDMATSALRGASKRRSELLEEYARILPERAQT